MKTGAPPLHLKRILVPLDFSDSSLRALDYGLGLAEPFAAKLVLLHVIEPGSYSENLSGPLPALEEDNESLLNAGRERLSATLRKHVGHRVPAETLVRIGRAYSEICDTARAMAIDLVILGSSASTALQYPILDSTTERVVRHAPCPVLTVRPPEAGIS